MIQTLVKQLEISTSKRTGEVNEQDEREFYVVAMNVSDTQLHPESGRKNMVETRITRKRNLSDEVPLQPKKTIDLAARLPSNIEMHSVEGRREALRPNMK